MPELTIRGYRETDESAVVELWREVFPNPHPWNDPRGDIRRKLRVQRELFVVALLDNNVVGTALGGYDGHRGWVYLVAVRPQHQRKGIGAALMHRVEHDLAALGCHKLNLQVRASNREVVQFYRSLGYHVEDRVSMGKLLGDEHSAQPEKNK